MLFFSFLFLNLGSSFASLLLIDKDGFICFCLELWVLSLSKFKHSHRSAITQLKKREQTSLAFFSIWIWVCWISRVYSWSFTLIQMVVFALNFNCSAWEYVSHCLYIVYRLQDLHWLWYITGSVVKYITIHVLLQNNGCDCVSLNQVF